MDIADLDASRSRIYELYCLLTSAAVAGGHIGMKDMRTWLNDRLELGEFDRRTISRDLLLLKTITNLSIEYNMRLRAYEVTLRDKLSGPELSIIVNAILSARFDSEQETKTLAEKLYALAGYDKIPGGAHQIKDRIKLGAGAETLDTLEFVLDAMERNIKILFDYRKYTLNRKFEIVRSDCLVSPYKILWQNDRLYLVGNFEGGFFSHYRIERICNLRETHERRKPIGDIVGYGRLFDEAGYLRRAVGLSRGELTRVVVRFSNECIGDVFDNLGKNVSIQDNHDGTFTLDDKITLNKKFTRWLLGFGAYAEVLKPDKLRNEIIESINSTTQIYI